MRPRRPGGVGVIAGLALSGLASSAAAAEGWTAVESPTGETLHDVEATTDGAYAIGGSGLVLDASGGKWSQDATPTGGNLKAVLRGDSDVAVGASGTTLEY